MFISDWGNNRVRKITVSTGIITTIAGTGTAGYSGDGGQATSAAVKYPHGLNLDSAGNVYIADIGAYNVIRKITVSTGIISTVAGTGSTSGGYNGDSISATSATLNVPFDVVLDSSDNLFIADTSNNRIRKVDMSTGVITTVVGTGTASSTGDGSAATASTMNGPTFSRFDSSGNYYISDCNGNRVRKVTTVTTEMPTVTPTTIPSTPTYYPSLSPHSITIITTIAGTGSAGYSGDGGQATSASIYVPAGITIDSSGNVYFSEFYNHRVRKITTATGIISTYAGTGSSTYSGDGGVASSAALNGPDGLCIDSSGILILINHHFPLIFVVPSEGNIYIGDTNNHRIRKVVSATSIISSIAGAGTGSYSGDNGPATSATFNQPVGIALDEIGKLH